MARRVDPVRRGVVLDRLARQLLGHERAADPVAVVDRIAAVQGQEVRGFRLAVRARTTPGATVAELDAALADGRLVVDWLLRGTLHLVAGADHGWWHQLCAPRQRTAVRRRLTQEGVDLATLGRALDAIAARVAEGPATRTELRAALDAAGQPTAGQALVHQLGAASIERIIVRGPMDGDEQLFVDAPTWLGPVAPIDSDEALARMARRYLAGHGPARPEDLAAWSGLPVGAARRGLAAIAADTVDAGDDLVALAADAEVRAASAEPAEPPPPRLLGPFDPILHGWASRAELVGGHGGVITSNGVFRPTALVDGRVVATWGLAGGVVRLRPFGPLTDETLAALADEAAAVLAFVRLPDAPLVVEG